MRFICDNCHAKYSIAEHKVRNKVLKIRCKRCSNVIVVRDPEAKKEQDLPVAAAPSSAVIPVLTSAGLDSLVPASSFQMRNEAPPSSASVTFASVDRVQPAPSAAPQRLSVQEPAEQRSERTMVARISADWFRQIREEKNEQPTWFYAVHNAPIGPVTLSDLQTAVIRCEVQEENLIWNAGWPNWRPAGEASELRASFLRVRGGIAEPALSSDDPEIQGALAGLQESSPYQTMDETIARASVDTDRDLYDDSSDVEGATSIQSISHILQQGREAGEDVSDLSAQLLNPAPIAPKPSFQQPIAPKPSFQQPIAPKSSAPEPALAEPAPPNPFAPFSPLGAPPSNAPAPKAPKGPSPLDWLNGTNDAPQVEEPKSAPFGAFAKAEPKSTEAGDPFSGLLGTRPRPSGASNGAMAAQSLQHETEKNKPEMPFPASVVERPAPVAPTAPIKNQDVAMESQALPAGMGDLVESSEEAMFFDRSYKESGTGNEIFEVELPPLPMVAEKEVEDGGEFDLSVDDDDILEELSDTIKPRTGRNVLLAGAGLIVVFILLSSFVAQKQIDKMMKKRAENAEKLINTPPQKLSEAQRRLQEELLRGSGHRPLPLASKPKKKKYRRPRSRARNRDASETRVAALPKNSKKQEMDAELLRRMTRRGHLGFLPGSSSNQPSVRVADSAGVDQSLLKKLVREIEANKEKVTFCYEQHLKSLTVSGRLVVIIEIETSGNVASVDVTTKRFRNTSLTRCIVRSMKRWRFTPFSGESLKMEVPYLLKAQY